MKMVLDASALIAFIFNEPGAENVLPHARGSLILAINFSEVAARIITVDHDPARAEAAVERLEIEIVPFDRTLALKTAQLRARTASIGASLADRACLALGALANLPVLSADKRWMELDLGIDIRMIR